MKKMIQHSIRLLLALSVALMLTGTSFAKEIKIGWTAWSDAEAVTKIAKKLLEERMGYKVKLTMADIGIQYQGISSGDLDIMLMSWLPVTHKPYMEKFGKDIVSYGILYTRARLGWAIPNYIPKDQVNSLADLAKSGIAEKFDKKIQGIDPGAGLMQASETAMKEYGLDEYTLVSSSGAAMTAALKRAISRDKWIVVTAWSPHWKFAEWDLRYLEEPKGILGGLERIHAMGRKGLYQDSPDAVEFFNRMNIPIADLQATMLEAKNTSYEKAVNNYIKNNEKRVHYWVTGEIK